MEYYHSYGYTPDLLGGLLIFLSTWLLLILLLSTVIVIAKWKIYEKAGRQGWEAIIPIYSTAVALQFLDLPIWLIFLMFIPGAVVVLPILIAVKLTERFGKDTAFAVGLILLPIVFYPILAFGDATFK